MREPRVVLELSGVQIGFGTGPVVAQVSFTLLAGESVALVGPSGSGKTSVLNAVLGTLRLRAGSIRVEGTEVVGLGGRALARLRAELLGVVFQHGELLGELKPVENVALPALIAGHPRAESVERATALLNRLGVPPNREATDQLSGGERQRTALARALINRPAVVLADEPTGSLDPATRDAVADLLFGAPREWGCGLVVVTHDAEVAARADRVVSLAGAALVR